MKRWRPKAERRNSYARRERFTDHMCWVKTLPCIALGLNGHVCSGAIEADHIGERGMGRKCHDFETVPLCKLAHDARPGIRGPFDPFSREEMRDWRSNAIKRTQKLALVASPDRAALRAWLDEKESASC